MLSLIVPVYRNAANLPSLLTALERINLVLNGRMEVVFVVDGSPDDSYAILTAKLSDASFKVQLIALSRNYGSFAAIQVGLTEARGTHMAVMAADLQEPPELIIEFDQLLRSDGADIVVGARLARNDPGVSKIFSGIYWSLYRKLVQPETPVGGIDIFGCNARVRDVIIAMRERNSSLVGLLLWAGFRRVEVPYERRLREVGRSAWTFSKKLRYMTDSVYGFTDLPVRLLTRIGLVGVAGSIVFGAIVAIARLGGAIAIPGYAATIIMVTFFGALNCLGLGIIGNYVWRTFENTKERPNAIIAAHVTFGE